MLSGRPAKLAEMLLCGERYDYESIIDTIFKFYRDNLETCVCILCLMDVFPNYIGFRIGIYLIFSVFLRKNLLSGSPFFCDVPLIFGWGQAEVASVDHVPKMHIFLRYRLLKAQNIERELPCLAECDKLGELASLRSASLAIKTALVSSFDGIFFSCGDFANKLRDNGRHPTLTKIKMLRF